MWKYRQTDRNNDWLMHAGGHKYVDKKMVNGKWVYTYPDEIARTSNTNGDPRLQRSQNGTVTISKGAVNTGKAVKSTANKLVSAYKNGNKSTSHISSKLYKLPSDSKKVERKPAITDKEDPNINRKANDARAKAMERKDSNDKNKAISDAKAKATARANARASSSAQRDARAKGQAEHTRRLQSAKDARANAMANKNERDSQVRAQNKAEQDSANKARARAMTSKNNRDATARFKENRAKQQSSDARANAMANKNDEARINTQKSNEARAKSARERHRIQERDKNLRYKKKK